MYRQMYKPFGEELIARIAKHASNQEHNYNITPEQAIEEAMDILNGLLAELGRNTKSIKKKALEHRDITVVSDTDSDNESLRDNSIKKRGRPKKVIKEEKIVDLIAGMMFDDEDVKQGSNIVSSIKSNTEAKKLAKKKAKEVLCLKEQEKLKKAEAKNKLEAEKLAKKKAKEEAKALKEQEKLKKAEAKIS